MSRRNPGPPDPGPALLFGIGNSGRGDDGLGWAFLDRLRADGRCPGTMEYRYQLQVEDAERISREKQVVFVDATTESLPAGFRWEPCTPCGSFEFTTHALPPASVLRLCERIYGRCPDSRLLLIEGHEWALGASLSAAAERNLAAALRSFDESRPVPGGATARLPFRNFGTDSTPTDEAPRVGTSRTVK